MSWIKLDDQFADHPKFLDIRRNLLDSATALWVRAIGHCNKHNTDGLIVRGAIYHLSASETPDAVAAELVRVGLWYETDRGWEIHDYHVYQPRAERASTARTEARLSRSEAGRRGAAARWQNDGKTMANASDSHSKPMANAIASDGKPMPPIPIPIPIPIPKHVPAEHVAAPMRSPQISAVDGSAESADSCHADGHRIDPRSPDAPNSVREIVAPPGAARVAGVSRRHAGRSGGRGASASDQRYRAAYETGIRDAAPGHGFSLPAGKVAGLLGPALVQHARGADGPLVGDQLDAWIRRTAAEFRRATASSGQYWNGYGVPGFVRWLNAGRPREGSAARSPAPRVDDRPERYGETDADHQARIDLGREQILERAAEQREARFAAMTPEQRAIEEELPL